MSDEVSDEERRESTRIALSMVRADWQGDFVSWQRLWQECEDREALARELVHICRETMERLATAAGVSTGEMLHRQALRLVPGDPFRPEAGAGPHSGRHRSRDGDDVVGPDTPEQSINPTA